MPPPNIPGRGHVYQLPACTRPRPPQELLRAIVQSLGDDLHKGRLTPSPWRYAPASSASECAHTRYVPQWRSTGARVAEMKGVAATELAANRTGHAPHIKGWGFASGWRGGARRPPAPRRPRINEARGGDRARDRRSKVLSAEAHAASSLGTPSRSVPRLAGQR